MNILRLDDRAYTDMHDYWYTARAYEHTYACNKIYKKELFDGLTFPEGRKFEDAYMLPLLLERAYCVATTSLGWYYYCHNPKGITMQAAIQCVAMQPNNLTENELPELELDWLKAMPTTWDETQFIDGYPGRYAVLARRHGDGRSATFQAGVQSSRCR